MNGFGHIFSSQIDYEVKILRFLKITISLGNLLAFKELRFIFALTITAFLDFYVKMKNSL